MLLGYFPSGGGSGGRRFVLGGKGTLQAPSSHAVLMMAMASSSEKRLSSRRNTTHTSSSRRRMTSTPNRLDEVFFVSAHTVTQQALAHALLGGFSPKLRPRGRASANTPNMLDGSCSMDVPNVD